MKYIIGLDIGGTKCAVVLAEFGLEINLIDKINFPTESEKGFEYTKQNLFQSIYHIAERNNLKMTEVSAIGVSCGGPLDSRTGIILCPPNLPGWINIPFVKMLEEEFKIPSFIQNDANACALVEWKLGAAKGAENMMFLTMGTGMGGGIIAEGKLLVGASDMGGEVGHIRIEEDGPNGFGKYGSFEGFCSGGGIARLAQDYARKAKLEDKSVAWAVSDVDLDKLDTKVLADYAKAGDMDAIEVFRKVGEKLGKGIALFIDILNPEVIVIGSIFGRCENLLRPAMEEVIEKECIPYSKNVCKVLPAETGEKIGDLASIMVAVYGLNLTFDTPDKTEIMNLYERLFVRYPILETNRTNIFHVYHIIKKTFEQGGKLLCCGNGGSAADSDHIVGELMKGFQKKRPVEAFQVDQQSMENMEDLEYIAKHLQEALPAIALTQHSALSSAVINDNAPDMNFAQQVYGYGNKNDTLFAISTSGNSANVVNAVKVAKIRGVNTIGLTGPKKSLMSELCDETIQVEGLSTAEIQELHLPVYHTLCAMLEAQFFDV
jgi:glucokinase